MHSSVVDLLIGKVLTLLESEASLIKNVGDELRDMHLELESMKSVLEDAQSATPHSQLEITWIAQVQDAAFQIQDIIDEFHYHKIKYQTFGKVRRCFNFPKYLCFKPQVASELQRFKGVLRAIPERKQRYDLNRPQGNPSQSDSYDWVRIHHESTLFMKEEDLVGFHDAKAKIMEWLQNEEEPECTVISIWGIGGSGKTTLVANAYNNPKTKRHFDCYAWVTVSQRYEVKDILESLIRDIHRSRLEALPADLSSMNGRLLKNMLVKYFEGKKYLIVFDDVWSSNLWNEICEALPKGMMGSRIVLSTSYEAVACYSFGMQSHVYQIKHLDDDESFSLFCKKAFSNKACPDNLKAIASKLVHKCEGLPLALVALGGAMFNKSESEWRMVDSSLTWQLDNNPDLQKMKTILLLSYHALPHRLKLCFLNCSVFPEDYLMRRTKLTWLWLAEGFLEEVRGLTPEQVAESYLMELVRRSLLQVVQGEEFGWHDYYKMHDILRETAIWISKREKFCTVSKDKEAIEVNNCRILSIQGNTDLPNEPRLWKSLSKVRSFFLFIPKHISSESIKLPYGFHLLRVLDLDGLNINKVPDEIANCNNLRYLSMAETEVRELPKSIGNLTQLLTLNLHATNIQVLRPEIARLHNLRHLIVTHKTNYDVNNFSSVGWAVQVTTNIGRLTNLHVLGTIQLNVDLVGTLRFLANLRKLDLKEVTEEVEEEMCLAINKMEYLHNLSIMAANENTLLHLELLSSTAPRLQELSLGAKLEKVPGWFQCLHNLTGLALYWTRLEGDILLSIEALPNLVILFLWYAYVSKQLHFGKGFQKLRKLFLGGCPQLNKITVEEGAIPNIGELWIGACEELKTSPNGIKYLASLQTIILDVASFELVRQIQKEFIGCEHQPKIILCEFN